MPSNNEQILVTRSTANDCDLYFVKSPFYWQNNNPSALAKNWHGYLRTVGCENCSESAIAPENKSDFESEIIKANVVIEDFRKFMRDGQKFGTINVTNAECGHFEMLKRMYGSIVYVVFEERAIPTDDPRKKSERHIAFFSEYDLCAMSQLYFHSDDSYYCAIVEKDTPLVSSMQSRNARNDTSWNRTRKKLYRNGFRLMSAGSNISYAEPAYPTEEEYFSNHKREKLDSQDMMNLLWEIVINSHRDEADPSISEVPGKSAMEKDLARELYRAKIVGFGWLPCLLAKRELNELDRYVLHFYGKCNIHNTIHKAEQQSIGKDGECKYRTNKVIVFIEAGDAAFHPVERYPLDKVVKIYQIKGESLITDVNGREFVADFIDFATDVPKIDVKPSSIPGKCIVTETYADGRRVKHEIDQTDWESQSFKLEESIPGITKAIFDFNVSRALKCKDEDGAALKIDDAVKTFDTVLSWDYSPQYAIKYISNPNVSYISTGTTNDSKNCSGSN